MAFQNIFGRLVDLIFGYDFFVSYTWADGSKYAHSLYEKLKAQGFTIFLDEEEYARGDALPCLSNLGQFSWVNRPNLRISSVYQSGSRNRLTLAQILAHRSGGKRAGPK
jgi:hypothetical protein